MTAEEAVRQAEAEGLTLLRSERSNSGYMGVVFSSSIKGKPYKAQLRRGGRQVNLGQFATAEEAALCQARTPEAQAAAAAPPEPPPITAEKAVRQAEAEGLTLLRSESGNSGYKGVTFNRSKKSKPYQAQLRRGGKDVHLGRFVTAEEAALCYARTPEAQAAAAAAQAAAAAPPAPPPMTAEEALRLAKAEGLTLLRSDNSAGYKGVGVNRSSKSNPYAYQSRARRDGKQVVFGRFATAEEAALCYARSPEGRAAAAAPPEPTPLTVQETLQQAEAEGLTLLRSESSRTGYRGVSFNSSLKSKPYKADVYRGGKNVHLGRFVTAEERRCAMRGRQRRRRQRQRRRRPQLRRQRHRR